jgi:hypothetical protein
VESGLAGAFGAGPGGAGAGGSEHRGAASPGHGSDDYLLGARRPFGAGEVGEGTSCWSFLFYFYKWFFVDIQIIYFLFLSKEI